jgi:hypothetical protein
MIASRTRCLAHVEDGRDFLLRKRPARQEPHLDDEAAKHRINLVGGVARPFEILGRKEFVQRQVRELEKFCHIRQPFKISVADEFNPFSTSPDLRLPRRCSAREAKILFSEMSISREIDRP